MIKSIHVSGLKSLKNFKLNLQSGLNVLVGPNGSGKSNILTAFELISRLNQLDNISATDTIGSTVVEELFDKFETNKKIHLLIEGEINDVIEYKINKIDTVNEDILLNYSYECNIKKAYPLSTTK